MRNLIRLAKRLLQSLMIEIISVEFNNFVECKLLSWNSIVKVKVAGHIHRTVVMHMLIAESI